MTADDRTGVIGSIEAQVRRSALPLVVALFGLLAVRLNAFSLSASSIRDDLIRTNATGPSDHLQRLLASAGMVTHELFVWSLGLLAISFVFVVGAAVDRGSYKVLRVTVFPLWVLFAYLCLRNMT